MKGIIRMILMSYMFVACGQQKNEKMEEVTFDNLSSILKREIKHYDVEPFYKIHSKGINCDYELLVNDFPVYKSYDGFSDFTGTPINEAILKSGKQTVTIKVFPLKEGTLLSKETNAYFKLVEVDNTTNHLDEKTITSLVLPSDADGNFTGAGLPYFEKTITFNATVPYELTGWSESQDLFEIDEDKLKQMTLDFYSQFGDLWVNKQKNILTQQYFAYMMEVEQSFYNMPSRFNQYWYKEIGVILQYPRKIIQLPLGDYVMKLYGNNRLVILETLIPRYKGESSFLITNEQSQERNGKATAVPFYLHIPKGKTALEIIR